MKNKSVIVIGNDNIAAECAKTVFGLIEQSHKMMIVSPELKEKEDVLMNCISEDLKNRKND